MPSLGADMRVGTLLSWKVKPGDRVKRGDIIAEVATDKGDIEIEVFDDGLVTEILVEAGREVPVGELLARIDPGGGGGASSGMARTLSRSMLPRRSAPLYMSPSFSASIESISLRSSSHALIASPSARVGSFGSNSAAI